jgi:hypothetical protein
MLVWQGWFDCEKRSRHRDVGASLLNSMYCSSTVSAGTAYRRSSPRFIAHRSTHFLAARRLLKSRAEVTPMDPEQIDDQNDAPRKDRNDDEEFIPGPLDEPSEANDSDEEIDEPEDDEDQDMQGGID